MSSSKNCQAREIIHELIWKILMHSSIKLSPIWRAFGKSFSPLHKSLFIIKFPSENAYQRPTLIWDTEPIFDVDRVVDGGKLLPTLELVYLKSKIPKCCLIQINLKWWLGQLVSVECSDWWLRPGPVCRDCVTAAWGESAERLQQHAAEASSADSCSHYWHTGRLVSWSPALAAAVSDRTVAWLMTPTRAHSHQKQKSWYKIQRRRMSETCQVLVFNVDA